MATHEQVGSTLRGIREVGGMSRSQVAVALDLSESSISRMELGQVTIDYPRLVLWLAFLEVDLDFFDREMARQT